MSLHDEMVALGDRAVAGARALATLSSAAKNALLEGMAVALGAQRAALLTANARDLAAGRERGLSGALLDRLALNDARIDAMIAGIRQVIALRDPVGELLAHQVRPDGLQIDKLRVPIGVIGIIYEARPNVTADAAVLCLKAGNAVILRGGSEAQYSNRAIGAALVAGGEAAGLPAGALQLVQTTDRDAVRELVQLVGRVDLVIPRGGEGLIRAVTEQARVPVIKHYKGVCHVYVDASADLAMALAIVENAKCQRPGTCNALETLLVHREVAAAFLPELAARLFALGVELRGDEQARALVPAMKRQRAGLDDEYLELILAVKRRPRPRRRHRATSLATARSTPTRSSPRPSWRSSASCSEVDSAAVYVNASTRFTDGGEFGMGAEIGISTDKLHARGPMGLPELTTYKYIVRGTGHLRR
jgi:glutamate-5-semialdehyde dehydrogenase